MYQGKNKVGLNLLLWTASISEKMNPIAEKIKEAGYDGVEIAMLEPATKPYVNFGKHLRSIDMEITTVFVLGKDEDPIHESKAIRDKAVDKLKWGIDRANDLGAKIICGPTHSAFGHFRNQAPSEDEYMRSADVLFAAGEYAAQSGVIFTVEAINRFECYLCNTTTQLSKLLTMVGHPNVRAMFDPHHANMEEKNFRDAIRVIRNNLAHVHISENDRGTPGAGHIQWDEIFSALSEINYRGWFTIEAFSRNDPAFANAINVWREYSAPWDIVTGGLAFIKSMQQKYQL